MKRRAVSTVVGAVFFVVVLGSSIGYVTYSMDVIGNLAESVTTKQDQNLNRQNEEFKITDVKVVGNEFNLTVTNTGSIPINITRMYAQNTTDSTWNQTKYQLNQLVSPGKSVSDIGINTGLAAMDSQSYDLKLTTERGNSINTQMLSISNLPLEMNLFTSPSTPLSGQNVTLLYSVKNNLTAGSAIHPLTPIMDVSGTGTAAIQGTVTPASVEGLGPGEIAFFEWTYEVTGSKNDIVVFNATLANAVSGNNVTDISTIGVAPVTEEAAISALSGAFGILTMNFTTFEACEPSADNCRSNNNDWDIAWEVDKATAYLWRMNVTNKGAEPLILKADTALLFIPGLSGGGSATPVPYFLRDDSTTSTENPGAYTDETKIVLVEETETLYFGSEKVGNDNIELTHGSEAIVGVSLLVFAYEDLDDSGTVNAGDVTYSQNLPFQAYKIKP